MSGFASARWAQGDLTLLDAAQMWTFRRFLSEWQRTNCGPTALSYDLWLWATGRRPLPDLSVETLPGSE